MRRIFFLLILLMGTALQSQAASAVAFQWMQVHAPTWVLPVDKSIGQMNLVFTLITLGGITLVCGVVVITIINVIYHEAGRNRK